MSLKILDTCVNCDVCEPVCPNQAIAMGPSIYDISPARCTECVGHFDTPQCVEVCPVECIIVDALLPESREMLLEKYHRLNAAMNTRQGSANA
jgi:ferredoxin